MAEYQWPRDSEGVVALNCLTRDLQRSNGMQRFGVSLGRTTVIFTRWSCLLLGQGPTAGPPPGRPMAVGCQSLDLRTRAELRHGNPMAPSRACECWTSTSQQPSHATAAQAQACSHLPSPDRDSAGMCVQQLGRRGPPKGGHHDVTERQAHGSQPVRVRSGETPGSPVAALPASGEIPASKRRKTAP